jgi:glucokinase
VRIGIDLGGTNLRGATFASASAEPRWTHKERVGEVRDPVAIVERVAAVVERLASDASGPVPVGVGIAAMLRDRQGTVALSPHLKWRGVPFGALLARRLGSRFAVGVYNDVNAVTWGEVEAGAARGCRDVLGVYVGTGIGGGVVADGRIIEGAASCAGEIGHVKVRWDDGAAPCECGSRGCVEAYLGGAYLERRIVRELSGKKPGKSRTVELAGRAEDVTVAHVDQAASEGDDWAIDLWSELAPLLAIALGNALVILNSERLVLGGGVLERTPTLCELVQTALMLVPPVPHLDGLEVAMAELGDMAGLVGAAALARDGVSIVG